MRILFLDQFSECGGAQLCLTDLLGGVLSQGWEAEVLAPGDGPLHDFCRSAGIKSGTLPLADYGHGRKRMADFARYPFDMLQAARKVRQRCLASQPRIVYVNGPRVLPAARAFKGPVVFHSHSFLSRSYSRLIVKWSLPPDAYVLAACRYVAEGLPRTSRILHNGVAEQGFLPRPRLRERFHIGMIGRIAPEKGQLDFVKTARILAGSRADVKFSITGDTMFADPGYARSVRELAAGLPLEFRGWTTGVAALLHDLDVLVVPSAPIDATPRVVMEALSAGTPIVAYRSGGIPELLEHGVTGLFASERCPEALTEQIGKLLSSPTLMAKVAEQGRRSWEQRFRLDRYRSDILSLLDDIDHNHRSKLLLRTAAAVR